ncbi:hypothetical protein AB0420_20670 [Streptomyces caelestis]|uniref:hypothetical protein n=1 Tax=Streptomyces caelestis TaxID=36816 RepID=UPI00344D66D1
MEKRLHAGGTSAVRAGADSDAAPQWLRSDTAPEAKSEKVAAKAASFTFGPLRYAGSPASCLQSSQAWHRGHRRRATIF